MDMRWLANPEKIGSIPTTASKLMPFSVTVAQRHRRTIASAGVFTGRVLEWFDSTGVTKQWV